MACFDGDDDKTSKFGVPYHPIVRQTHFLKVECQETEAQMLVENPES